MSYEYQQDILSALHEDVERHIEDKNYIRKGHQNLADMHRCDAERMSGELNEVYAKAKAWDEFEKRQQMMVVELPRDLPGSDKEIYFHEKALFVMDQCYRAVILNEGEAE